MFHVKHWSDMGLFLASPGDAAGPPSAPFGGCAAGGSLHRANASAGIAAGPVRKTGATAPRVGPGRWGVNYG